MTVFFPQAIGLFAEAIVSVRRLEKFMKYEEIGEEEDKNRNATISKNSNEISSSPNLSGKKSHGTEFKNSLNDLKYIDDAEDEPKNGIPNQNQSSTRVYMKNLKAKWNSNLSDYTLDDVTLDVKPGTIALVMGLVGAGKSSLLQTILGELPVESGELVVNGKVSYASQEPWLFSGSVRQNILFGTPMDSVRYKTVVRKCALNRDFELWPNGDKTIVGERGMSLSGGQKARINLARAIYRKANIYLLDDPLSAVDTHVSRHLFEQCIKDFLKDKIVILVTHQLQYLQSVDQIILLEHGKINCAGTFESLKQAGYDVEKLLSIVEPEEEKDNSIEGLLDRKDSIVERRKRRSTSRQDSESSLTSIDEDAVRDAMAQEEKRAEGSVGLKIYKAYALAGGGYCIMAVVLSFFIIAQIFASAGDYFLSYWVEKEEGRKPTPSVRNDTVLETTSENPSGLIATLLSSTGVDYDRNIDIYIFSGIIVLTVVITLSRSFLFFDIAMRASRNLHNAMFDGVSRATMYFFNTNPSGRILNRFSKDMGQVDEILPSIMIDVIQIFLSLFGIIIVIAIVNPWYIIPTAIIFVLFYFMRNFYLGTSRVIKRMVIFIS